MASGDFEWEPPSEAEMKLLQARRERSDKISKLMGDYLLKGYKMLGKTCQACDTILLQDPQGTNYCIACSELDTDADKDDPVTSQTAALSQARELHFMTARGSDSSVLSTPGTVQESTQRTTATPTNSEICEISSRKLMTREGNFINVQEQMEISSPVTLSSCQCLSAVVDGRKVENQKYIRDLLRKMDWATQELNRTTNIEHSIQLCQLVKSCAEAVSSVRAALDV